MQGEILEQLFIEDAQIERVVETYSDMLLRLCLHYVRQRSEAEDIVQTVYLRMIQSAPVFSSESHEKAWLIRTAINLCKDFYKSAAHRTSVPLYENSAVTQMEEPSDVLPLVRALPKKYKNVIYLYYYEQLTVPEISKMLGEKESTIASQLHRARNRLRTMMKGEDA